jgi:hypothetical protein
MLLLRYRVASPATVASFAVSQQKILREEKKKHLADLRQLADPLKPLEKYTYGYQPKHDFFTAFPNSFENVNFERDSMPALRILEELGFFSFIIKYRRLGCKKTHFSRLWSSLPSSLLVNQPYAQNDVAKLLPFLKTRLDLQPKYSSNIPSSFPTRTTRSMVSSPP